MTKKPELVVTRPGAAPLPNTDTPVELGQWYWCEKEAERWFGCVTHVGSNYVQLTAPGGGYERVHLNEFWTRCERELDPDGVIREHTTRAQAEVQRLLGEVQELTARLAIAPSPELATEGAQQALARLGDGPSVDAYKLALEEAKRTTLPELFKSIEQENSNLAAWMRARILPFKAQAETMKRTVGQIDDRIFSVELYAGLTETVTAIADGDPAALAEPLHLLQRRHYMDEECLVAYETGGMEFRNIGAFDAWLARPANRDRLLPFPRCIVAFQVRRKEKEREAHTLSAFIQILALADLDKLTMLYLRNGDRLYRLNTAIEFGEQLFPDMGAEPFGATLYARTFAGSVNADHLITENEYLGMVEEEAAKRKATKRSERWRLWERAKEYVRFDRETVYYDDIAEAVAGTMKEHNRLAFVIQGLLDRSPVFHPHPPWQIWTEAGFRQAVVLVYDSTRALVAGPAPDFAAYRARLNASLAPGSITVGQERAWRRRGAAREVARRERSAWRYKQYDFGIEEFAMYGDPGPGKLATVAKCAKRTRACTFVWQRKRVSEAWHPSAAATLGCSITVPAAALLNVSAYQPGDFRQFFADPRTRADYLKWAPILLEAEEFHAGNRRVGPEEDS